jgi:hypothetical protein
MKSLWVHGGFLPFMGCKFLYLMGEKKGGPNLIKKQGVCITEVAFAILS